MTNPNEVTEMEVSRFALAIGATDHQNLIRQALATFLALRTSATSDAAELTALEINIFSIIEDYAIAVSRKNVMHASYLGKAMPDDIYEYFKGIRDIRIPAHRAEIKRAINAAIAAGGSQS